MTDEEKNEIYNVKSFPKDDLSHLCAGTPPDKDFSNAKPTNQVNANTFSAYLEPFMRPINEEDMAFLRERVSIGKVLISSSPNERVGRSGNTDADASAWQTSLH